MGVRCGWLVGVGAVLVRCGCDEVKVQCSVGAVRLVGWCRGLLCGCSAVRLFCWCSVGVVLCSAVQVW